MSEGVEGDGNLPSETHSRAFSNSENPRSGSDEKASKMPIEVGDGKPPNAPPSSLKCSRNLVSNKSSGSYRKKYKDDKQEHEIRQHIGRDRRNKVKNVFSNLHTLLPQLPAKADKATIVEEVVKYIRNLQHTLQELEKRKLEKLKGSSMVHYDGSKLVPTSLMSKDKEAYLADQGPTKSLAMMNSNDDLLVPCFPQCLHTWSSPNVVLSINGADAAQICICTGKKQGLLPMIFYILEKNKMEVITAQVSSNNFRTMLMTHAHETSKSYLKALPKKQNRGERKGKHLPLHIPRWRMLYAGEQDIVPK